MNNTPRFLRLIPLAPATGLFAFALAAASSPLILGHSPSTAPATRPTTSLTLTCQTLTSRLQFLQNDKPLPILNHTLHLKPAPFSLRIKGNLDVALIAATSDALNKSLPNPKHPLALMGGTGMATRENELYLNEKAAVIPYNDSPFKSDDNTQRLREHFSGELPQVLNAPFQYPVSHAKEGADELTATFDTLVSANQTITDDVDPNSPKVEWKSVKTLHILLIALAPGDDRYSFSHATPLPITLLFDQPADAPK